MWQVFRGFVWPQSFRLNPVERAVGLIRTFGAAWPPRSMPAQGSAGHRRRPDKQKEDL
jgi:hypothetical protein